MIRITLLIYGLFLLVIPYKISAQDSSRINVSSSAGIIFPLKSFGNSFENSFSISSGLILNLKKKMFINGTFSVNMIKYNQSQFDVKSPFLFTNTSSPFFQINLNFGRNFELIRQKRLIFSPYLGVGAFMLNEPRLTLNQNSQVISQSYQKHFAPQLQIGQRLYFNTKTKLLRYIFVDTFYWKSNLTIQNANANAFSLMFGTKIGN